MSDEMPAQEPTRRQWIGFWNMIVQQTQNAFNDKVAQFILIPLGGAVGFAVESGAGLMIALPFVLFAPIAGWLSDRFSKRHVMLGTAIAQLIILFGISGAVIMRNMPLALVGFFALAAQSAFFGPAKIGITKELVGSSKLGFAAGIQQMMTMLAILAGQIAAGIWFDIRYRMLGEIPDVAWQAALVPLLIFSVLSIPTIFMAWALPRVPAQGSEMRLTPAIAISHFKHLGELWSDAPMRRASWGIAFFWGFAAFINLWSVKLAKLHTGGGEGFGTLASIYMCAASLGMAAGFAAASWLLRKKIELGWVPLAGLAMSLVALAMAFSPTTGWFFLILLTLVAFFAAIFLAPLNAWIQDRYPPAKRGELQSAVNLQDCFAGITAVVVIEGIAWIGGRLAGLDPYLVVRIQIAVLAILGGLMSAFIIRLLPADFLRLVGIGVVRSLYRIKAVHPEHVPASGGVLLLPNHVSFADAFFLSAACPRPIRFVMDESFIKHRAIRVFTAIFQTVTIRLDQPREALRISIEALKNGDVVCLFPEGQLTRTGTLSELRRGFELIARKAGAPMLPVWCAGAWGSIFSFERGRFFKKRPHQIPYPLVVAFGDALPPETATLEAVHDGLLRASAVAIAHRDIRDTAERAPDRINAHQLTQIHALETGRPFASLEGDPTIADLSGPLRAYATFARADWKVRRQIRAEEALSWVGGQKLRQALETAGLASKAVFYDFGNTALIPFERLGVIHCPCLALDGKIIAMSMPDPEKPLPTSEFQAGRKPGSWGKLLPGWYLEKDAEGFTRVAGPAAPEGLLLPPGAYLDAEGFLCRGLAGHDSE